MHLVFPLSPAGYGFALCDAFGEHKTLTAWAYDPRCRTFSCLAIAAAQDRPPVIPGFDHRAMIDGRIQLVASGKAEAAVEYLWNRMRNPEPPAAVAEDLQKKFAIIYGAAGTYEGHEVSGYRKLSSRFYMLYVPVFFDKGTVYFGYNVEKVGANWKIHSFRMWDKLNDYEKLMQFVPLAPGGGTGGSTVTKPD